MANELLFTNAEATWLPLLVMVMITSSAIEESIIPKGGMLVVLSSGRWRVEMIERE